MKHFLLFLISLSTIISAEIIWNGSHDSNWNSPENWSSGNVPGMTEGDSVLLTGRVTPVVATIAEAPHPCAISVNEESTLEVTRSGLKISTLTLGDAKGAGHLLMRGRGEAVLPVDHLNADLASSIELRTGTLEVAETLNLASSSLTLHGSAPALKAKNLTIDSDSILRLNFHTTPMQPLQVSENLTIEEGAKLVVDLRHYTMGGNALELIQFSSVTGAFTSENIEILGLSDSKITMDEDSLNLTVVDDVAARSSTLWFVMTGGDGTSDHDLQVNSGRRIRDLSSPDLSYVTKSDDNAQIHSVSWTGSDFNGDGENDEVSFDLRVEGFSGSAYKTTEETAHMTKLGSPAPVNGTSEGWQLSKGLRAGDSLRFTIENLKVSVPPKEGEISSFVGLRIMETDGGKGHEIIIGEGENLPLLTSNASLKTGIKPTFPLVLTSAASSKASINEISLRLQVSALPDTMGSEAHDYSVFPTGPQHLSNYPPVTKRIHSEFSWDTVPMTARVNNRNVFPEDFAKIMATNYDKIGLGGNSHYGSKYKDEGVFKMAALLKSYNPKVILTTYRNAGVHFTGFSADEHFNEEEWFDYVLDDNGERKYITYSGKQNAYNHDHPDMRKWWVDTAAALMEDPNIDGIFIDKANGGDVPLQDEHGHLIAPEGKVQSYLDLQARLPEGAFLTGNTLRTNRPGANREMLHIYNGAYLESWEKANDDCLVPMTVPETTCASIQLIREARLKGFDVFTNFRELKWHRMEDAKVEVYIKEGREKEVYAKMKQALQYPLAFYLITAEPYSYFQYQTSTDPALPEFCWNAKDHFDEFTHPLGKPLGPPQKDGYIYTRSYEHVDVWLDVEHKKSRLTWDWQPIAHSQQVEGATDKPLTITLTGEDPRKTDLTYKLYEFSPPKHGTLTGTPPNLTYTPKAGYTGEDQFQFQCFNDIAESLVGTIEVIVK